MAAKRNLKNMLAIVGPGILVAATGVGAGDLATAAFTGAKLGLTVLWAVVVGAFLKFVINEGLARWQLATDSTLLEGCVQHLGKPFQFAFVIYLFVWSYLVGAALMSACGATAHAIFPIFTPERDKILYGLAHSAVAVILVRLGGYQLFEKVMTVCIGIMFGVVVLTALALQPPLGEVLRGLLVPKIPPGGLDWTVALLGGVGGTLTVLCYGYWIREEGRTGTEHVSTCRIDLLTGYIMTALFGMAMLVIGSTLVMAPGGRGASLLVELAEALRQPFGRLGVVVQWSFLLGAWGAVFSSLLGVWQSLPYLFADYCQLISASQSVPVSTKSWAYRGYLYAIATLPAIGLIFSSFKTAQRTYAVVGALVIPALAAILLYLNNQKRLVGVSRNSWKSNSILIIALVFFVYAGVRSIMK